MRKSISTGLIALLIAAPLAAQAGNRSDAVIGSIIGGATGAVIGNNLGGRDGAIVGGAIGAAAGVAIATDHRGDNSRQYDNRYSNNGYRDDRRHRRGDDRHREVVVVESPRHYYQGNEFVYGVPPRHDNGHHRGWDHPRYGRDRGREVVIIRQPSRDDRYGRYDDDGRYCPPPRRW